MVTKKLKRNKNVNTLHAQMHRIQKNEALRRVREHYTRYPESLANRQLLEVDMLRTVKQEALRNEHLIQPPR